MKQFAFVLALLCGTPVYAQTVFQDCPDCPEMIALDDGSAIGATTVTRAQFAAFAEETGLPGTSSCFIRYIKRWKETDGHGWADPGFEQGDDHPAVCMNWLEATAYADWLSEKTGQFYRLPTFEESADTAAAGVTEGYWWGETSGTVCDHANGADANFKAAFPEDGRNIRGCDDGYTYTSPVKAFPPNALGLYDPAGNVFEWTNTCLKGDCSNAIFRGASWVVPFNKHFFVDGQWADRILLRNSGVGFRVFRDAE